MERVHYIRVISFYKQLLKFDNKKYVMHPMFYLTKRFSLKWIWRADPGTEWSTLAHLTWEGTLCEYGLPGHKPGWDRSELFWSFWLWDHFWPKSNHFCNSELRLLCSFKLTLAWIIMSLRQLVGELFLVKFSLTWPCSLFADSCNFIIKEYMPKSWSAWPPQQLIFDKLQA